MGAVTLGKLANYDKHCHGEGGDGEGGDGSSDGNTGGSVSKPTLAPLSGTNLPHAPSLGASGVSSYDPFPYLLALPLPLSFTMALPV